MVLVGALTAVGACSEPNAVTSDAGFGGPAQGSGGAGTAPGGTGGNGPPQVSVCASGALPAIEEDRSVYASMGAELVTMRLTVVSQQAFADVNNDVPGAKAEVIFQEGDFGRDATTPNATIEVRGRSARLTKQKSFQVTLNSHTDLWRGSRRINLNKHPFDLTRVRNKLAFDLFQTVPNLTSLRTQFVQLIVGGDDYGLFTYVEHPDGRFLAAHGLDPAGTIYKPNDFQWAPLDDETAADPAALAFFIEDKANPDLARLNRAIRDVRDTALDINQVIARRFNRKNYVTWLATNILLGNLDSGSSNYLLYSPSGCDAWYFLPWDYDGAMEFYQQPGQSPPVRWRAGVANWWWIPLHQRFLRDPANLRELIDTLEALQRGSLSDDALTRRRATYHDLVKARATVPPDLHRLPTSVAMTPDETIAQWEAEYARLGGVVGRRLADFHAAMGRPMPVWLYEPVPPVSAGQPFTFSWSPSFHLNGGAFTYELEISTTIAFAPGDLVLQQKGLRAAIAMVQVPPGSYYWRVIIRADDDPDNNWQTPFAFPKKLEVAPL